MASYYEDEIKRMQRELKQEKEHESNLEVAKSLHDIYSCHLEAGFTEEQAWEIFITLLKKKFN